MKTIKRVLLASLLMVLALLAAQWVANGTFFETKQERSMELGASINDKQAP